MPFNSLRDFLQRLGDMGDLKTITAEVDWDQEATAIATEAVKKDGPALLFENIKDHKNTPGKKLTINSLANLRRVAVALDLPPDTHPRDILLTWRKKSKNLIKPILVNNGPCKEVIKKGSDVNVLDFPIPKLHPLDGGRYIIWNLSLTKDPETGWINVGMYNSMVHEKNLVGYTPIPTQHGMMHARKYHDMGRELPYAIAIGCEPVIGMAACAPFPPGVCEYDVAGGLRGEPLQLVKCETVDLEVPATAEIVMEGTVSLDPRTYRKEGPFGRYTGSYGSLIPQGAPVFKVNCITHRKDPILATVLDGTGHEATSGESEVVCTVNSCAAIWDYLEAAGHQITGVWNDPDAIWTNIFISIDKTYLGEAKQVASALWGSKPLCMRGKHVVVVDSDVDVFDLKKVNAAIAFRTRGKEDLIIFPYTVGSPLDPGAADPEFRIATRMGRWDRLLIDATWPFEWEAREEWAWQKRPPSCLPTSEMAEKVISRWKEYGL